MTYRELLQLYKAGKLDEETRKTVESAIEQQEAIGEFLFNEDNFSDLPPLLAEESAPAEDSERFLKMIQKSIKRTLIKLGLTVGAIVLSVLIGFALIAPRAVSHFYYDPTQIVGQDPQYENLTTQRMELDLAVYTELYLPGQYRDQVLVEPEGWGRYDVSFRKTTSPDGRFPSVHGRLVRNKLTLYDPDPMTPPVGNAFLSPEGVNNGYFFDGYPNTIEERKEESRLWLEGLNDYELYQGFISLDRLMDYPEFYQWYLALEAEGYDPWCAVAPVDEYGYLACDNLGFRLRGGGFVMYYDEETYPYLTMTSAIDQLGGDVAADPALMQTHFTSMLRWQMDHPEFTEMMGRGCEPDLCERIIGMVERDGIQVLGLALTAHRDVFEKILDDPHVSYLYVTPLP